MITNSKSMPKLKIYPVAIGPQVARAFNQVYGLRLTTRGEMEVAYQGERLTPSQCGRMDQVRRALRSWFIL